MDKSEVGKDIKKNIVNMVLQDALDILDADDGRSFEEKRDAVIELLTQKDNTEASQLPVERAIADKDGSKLPFGNLVTSSPLVRLFSSGQWSQMTARVFSPFKVQILFRKLWRKKNHSWTLYGVSIMRIKA